MTVSTILSLSSIRHVREQASGKRQYSTGETWLEQETPLGYKHSKEL